MDGKGCKYEGGCTNKHYSMGFCRRHYKRYERLNDPRIWVNGVPPAKIAVPPEKVSVPKAKKKALKSRREMKEARNQEFLKAERELQEFLAKRKVKQEAQEAKRKLREALESRLSPESRSLLGLPSKPIQTPQENP